MGFLSWLLGGHAKGIRRSTKHRLGWPEPSVKDSDSYEGSSVWPAEGGEQSPPRPAVLESPEQAAERERRLRGSRPGKPQQRGRRQRKRK
jgi:hypothetical protein